MSDQVGTFLQLVIGLLPIAIGTYSIIALIVAIRGIVRARREAYAVQHEDFRDLKGRVRKELEKDESDE